MRILKKRSDETKPRLSMVFLDWSVRDSFHILHYLREQTVERTLFEIIVIEYYDRVSDKIREFEDVVDTWVLLEVPRSCHYHKHLMYNAGVIFAQGDILLFGDSDAMVRPTFVETILHHFGADPSLVYHIDQFRNIRRDLYPFRYPSFEDVVGEGCFNYCGGMTKGILDEVDPMHTRNYGACMCARREDVIAIGGADEDLSYLGHICGPYEMTFRLMNFGRRLVWETGEYMYHTWHPGSDGTEDYFGPHDGLQMSATAFEALHTARVRPRVENEAIRRLRESNGESDLKALTDSLINPAYVDLFDRERLGGSGTKTGRPQRSPSPPKELWATYRGYDVYRIGGRFYGVPVQMGKVDPADPSWLHDTRVVQGEKFSGMQAELERWESFQEEETAAGKIYLVGRQHALVPRDLEPAMFYDRIWRTNARIVWGASAAELRSAAGAMPDAGTQEDKAQGEQAGRAVAALKAELQAELARVAKRIDAGDARASQAASVVCQNRMAIDAAKMELRDELASLADRVGKLDRQVATIYRSRVWQALLKFRWLLGGEK